MGELHDLIFRAQVIVRGAQAETGFIGLDPDSREILYFLGEVEIYGKKVNVSEIARNPRFGSPAKVYQRIARLIDAGWIEATAHPSDGRGRLLSLGKPSVNAFNRMSNKLQSFVAGGRLSGR